MKVEGQAYYSESTDGQSPGEVKNRVARMVKGLEQRVQAGEQRLEGLPILVSKHQEGR